MTSQPRSGTAGLRGLARSSTLNLVGGVGTAVLVFGLTFVLTRWLGEGRAGAFFAVAAVFQVVIATASLGVDTGLVKWISGRRAESNQYHLTQLLTVALVPVITVATAIAGAGFFLADRLGLILGDGRFDAMVADVARVSAIFVPAAALYLALLGATRGYGTMLPTVAVDRLLRPFLQLLFVWGVLGVGIGSSVGLAAAWALPYLLGLVAAAGWVWSLHRRDTTEQDPTTSLSGTAAKFWRFTLPRSVGTTLASTQQWLDVVIVGILATPEATAIYTVATRLVQFGAMATFSLAQSIEPRFGDALARGDTEAARRFYQTSTGWLIAVTWPVYLITAIFAPGLLGIFGPAFVEGNTLVLILAGAVMVGAALGPIDSLLLMAGKSTLSLWNSGISVAVHVGLNILLIPRIGIVGAGIAWAANRVLGNLLAVAQVHHFSRIHPFGPGWGIAAALTVALFGSIGLATRTLVGPSLGGAVVAATLAGAGYLVALRRHRQRLELQVFSSPFRKDPVTSRGPS